jgi:chromate transporter
VLALGWVFLRIGAIAFGGLGAALILVERDLVDKRRWLTPTDLTEALTYTKLLPGSTVVLAALYVAATALPVLGPAVNGLTAAVVGVLLATTYRLGKANIKGPVALGMAVAACGVGVWLGVNAALIVVAAGVLGILLFATEPTTAQ